MAAESPLFAAERPRGSIRREPRTVDKGRGGWRNGTAPSLTLPRCDRGEDIKLTRERLRLGTKPLPLPQRWKAGKGADVDGAKSEDA